MENNIESKKGSPLLGFIVIGVIIVLIFKMCSGGHKCINCHGEGWIKVYGIKDKCYRCGGDGKESEEDRKAWNSR